MVDVYLLLWLRSWGTGILAFIAFIAFLMFFFSGENGTGRLFGITMLFISLYATMVTTTSVAIITSQNLLPANLDFYYSFWIRETIAIWAANVTIIILGIYLWRKND